MLSSRNEGKQDARFAARLDVLSERIDTLASTIATTASAIAKKDGEIAALQRAFESRDETLRALVQHVNRAAEAQAADGPVDANELRSLRNAVAALTKERASGVTAAHIAAVDANVRTLAERVEALAVAAAAPPVPAPDPATTARIEELAAEIASVRAALDRPPEELVSKLSALRDRMDGLAAELAAGVTEEQLDRRLGEADRALEDVSRRLESLAARTSRVDSLSTRFEATDDALAKQSSRLDALADRLASTESARAAHDEQLDRRLREANEALEVLSQRLEDIQGVDEHQLDRRFEETRDALATLAGRLDSYDEALGAIERRRAGDEERTERRLGETSDALTELSRRLEARQEIDEAELERRFEQTDRALEMLSRRLTTLAETVESAASGLGDREDELASLHRNFTDSSTRIESIVDDIRAALHAFPVPSSTSLDELAARLERIETATRKSTESNARVANELSTRIDLIDQRVAAVAEEVSRAKTLWPVALRSLEARLDDAVHGHRPAEPGPDVVSDDAPVAGAPADDLLAGLRDSLQAMETVAAEMARASDTLGESSDDAPSPDVPPPTPPSDPEQAPAAAAGGATIVPLRTGEP